MPNFSYHAIHISDFRRLMLSREIGSSMLPDCHFFSLLLICYLYDGRGGCRFGISWRRFGLIYDGLPSAFMMECSPSTNLPLQAVLVLGGID